MLNIQTDWGQIKALVGRWFKITGEDFRSMAVLEIFDYFEWAFYYQELEAYYIQVGMV
jgi:hypothetical protein